MKGNGGPARFRGQALHRRPAEGFRQKGATFDRFGLMNMTKPGGPMTIHFGDLNDDGKLVDLVQGPRLGRRPATTPATPMRCRSARTTSASARRRTSPAARRRARSAATSGAAASTPTTPTASAPSRSTTASKPAARSSSRPAPRLRHVPRLVQQRQQGPDARRQSGNFLGVHVGGPTRVGHYFHAARRQGSGAQARQGVDFLDYLRPHGQPGKRLVTVKLGDEWIAQTYKPGQLNKSAKLDRFGLCTATTGGQVVKIYFDDLTYTASTSREPSTRSQRFTLPRIPATMARLLWTFFRYKNGELYCEDVPAEKIARGRHACLRLLQGDASAPLPADRRRVRAAERRRSATRSRAAATSTSARCSRPRAAGSTSPAAASCSAPAGRRRSEEDDLRRRRQDRRGNRRRRSTPASRRSTSSREEEIENVDRVAGVDRQEGDRRDPHQPRRRPGPRRTPRRPPARRKPSSASTSSAPSASSSNTAA